MDCNKSFLGVLIDFDGTEDRSTCVYATLAVMYNDTIQYHVVSCAPHGVGEVTGPEWLIRFLQRASVIFVFSVEEAELLYGRRVSNVWDTQSRVPRNNGEKPALSDAWSESIGAGLGVKAFLKAHDRTIDWTTRVEGWRAVYHNDSRLPEDVRKRGWSYAMADVVASLQLGLVQWVRGDAIVTLKPSKNDWHKHSVKMSHGVGKTTDGTRLLQSRPPPRTGQRAPFLHRWWHVRLSCS